VRTRAAGSGPPDITWWRDSAARPGITLRGSIAAGQTYRFTASHPDGRSTYLAAVAEALRLAGIRVRSSRTMRTSALARTVPLVTLRSAPLREVLGAMQKPSQNQIAEVLFRTLGRTEAGSGTPDSARAVVERQLDAWGVRRDAHAVRDGSGLSRHDYLTPRLLVQVLDTMRRSTTFEVFHAALPLAGSEGTLRNRMQQVAQGRVRAKTGTIDKARALSGYVTTADGEMVLFSIIANTYTVPTREVDRVAELIVARLVTLRRSGS
jgi:D-alanyl-D-alanine carboxypeptidase/D-alanyl-D-alanine-endopeptidase (penicillin-binding protein 4)